MEKATTSLFLFQIDPKHYPQHNYLTFCNDVLVSILRYADATKLSTTKLVFNTKADFDAFEQAKKESEDWQEWLLHNGHHNELYEAYFRHTFFSLIADFCNYMLESINCAAKMKVAVSYALLRKPLKDTLGYTVPAIMSYALDLICDMFESFAPLTRYTILINSMNRTLKMCSIVNGTIFDDLKQLYMNTEFPIFCPECKCAFEMTDDLLLGLMNDELICPNCEKKIDSTRYMFDWEANADLSAK